MPSDTPAVTSGEETRESRIDRAIGLLVIGGGVLSLALFASEARRGNPVNWPNWVLALLLIANSATDVAPFLRRRPAARITISLVSIVVGIAVIVAMVRR